MVILVIFVGCSFGVSTSANCLYLFVTGEYACLFSAETFVNENDITKIRGTHVDQLDDNNVTIVWNSAIAVVPVTPLLLCERFKNIHTIVMNSVEMEAITDSSFSNCHHLRKLDLVINRITEITANAFRNNFQLEEIFLSSNPITHIDDNSFRYLTNLRTLELHSTQLQRITPATFRGLINLTHLRLNGAAVAELTAEVFSDLHSIKLNF